MRDQLRDTVISACKDQLATYCAVSAAEHFAAANATRLATGDQRGSHSKNRSLRKIVAISPADGYTTLRRQLYWNVAGLQ